LVFNPKEETPPAQKIDKMHRATANKQPTIIIFTDLDGTLFDYDNYSFEAARETLAKIMVAQIPLIFCKARPVRKLRCGGRS
jgi:ribonucleotide monophosphatase NagD (HAD superfamily)